MGGPIKKDKLFFFGSGEGVREDLTPLQSEHTTRDDRLPSNKPSVQQQYHGPADQCELGLPAAGAAVFSEGRSFQ